MPYHLVFPSSAMTAGASSRKICPSSQNQRISPFLSIFFMAKDSEGIPRLAY
jgi:hypothetical protein